MTKSEENISIMETSEETHVLFQNVKTSSSKYIPIDGALEFTPLMPSSEPPKIIHPQQATIKKTVFTCGQCGYITDRKNNLKRHISTMHDTCEQMLECCGFRFQSKASFRSHTFICHRDGYSCSICGRKFCRKALLKRHFSIHNGRKEFSCSECGYGTSHKSNLDRHKKVHKKSEKVMDSTTSTLPLKKRPIVMELDVKRKGTPTRNNKKQQNSQKNGTPYPKDNGWTEIKNSPNSDKEIQPGSLNFSWPLPDTIYKSHFPNLYNFPAKPADSVGFYSREYCTSNLPQFPVTHYCDQSPSPSIQSNSLCTSSDSEHGNNEKYNKLRLYALPYKCFNCGASFSTQSQLTYHTQYLHPEEDVVAVSIVNAIRKNNKNTNETSKKAIGALLNKDELQHFLLEA